MLFGKIEYLNLLPFHIFMKRFTKSTKEKMSMEYKKDVPAKINREFIYRRVDAAFISSIRAKNQRHINLGIIARDEVLSVIVIPSQNEIKDKESETSNLLAKLLGIRGEVLIGDKALRYHLQNKPKIDLAKEWHKKYNLPFVFALLCYHKDGEFYKKVEKNFLKKEIKIPQYLLSEASKKTQIPKKEILKYLKHISYNLDTKAKQGLKKFYKEANKVK